MQINDQGHRISKLQITESWLRERRKGERGTRKASHNVIWNIVMEKGKGKTEKKKSKFLLFNLFFLFACFLSGGKAMKLLENYGHIFCFHKYIEGIFT